MKDKLIFGLLLLISGIVISTKSSGQILKRTLTFQETFDNNNNKWDITNIAHDSNSSIVTNGQYICNLPFDNKGKWNYTWVNLPKIITDEMDSNENIELEFSWHVIKNSDDFRLGLMFNTHNVTTACPGGDFRIIQLTGDENNVYTDFVETSNCGNQVISDISGTPTANATFNVCRLVKTGISYKVFINESQVLDFQLKGKLNLDNLNFGKGTYAFDDFKIYMNQLNLKPHQIKKIDSLVTRGPKVWVLVSGIQNYLSENKLKYAAEDAKSMYKFWTNDNGGKVPLENIKLLLDDSATSERVLSSAEELFSQAEEKDMIITFICGHGGTSHFCTFNGAVRYEDLNKVMSDSKAKTKLCIVDACRAGSATVDGVLSDTGVNLTEQQSLALFYNSIEKSSSDIGYLLACKGEENSIEEPSRGHGLFTYCLLQGLCGPADLDHNHVVSLQEVFDYLTKAMSSLDKNQTPELKGKYNLNTPLAVVSTR